MKAGTRVIAVNKAGDAASPASKAGMIRVTDHRLVQRRLTP